MGKISNNEILTLMQDCDLDIFQVIDVIVEANGLVGVGLIDLENMIVLYIREKAQKVSKTPRYPEAMND